MNETIPDLSVAGNRDKWYRLEAAKRRVLYSLDVLNLPYGNAADGIWPPLSFDFKADIDPQAPWWDVDQQDRVRTGHQRGKITINIREADSVERERERILCNEFHRTLIGHFRHEFGHYYWMMFVAGIREDELRAVFGDHRDLPYADALNRYYRQGPPGDWPQHFVSAYASMHPWEDFAETFGVFLAVSEICETAGFHGLIPGTDVRTVPLDAFLKTFGSLVLAINELNRGMGLADLLPAEFAPKVVEKLSLVQQLVGSSVDISRGPAG